MDKSNIVHKYIKRARAVVLYTYNYSSYLRQPFIAKYADAPPQMERAVVSVREHPLTTRTPNAPIEPKGISTHFAHARLRGP